MKGNEFVFDSVYLLNYKLHKISLNRGGSYTDFSKQLKNKVATTTIKHNDENCLRCAKTVALNDEQIKKDPQRIAKIKTFIDQYLEGDFLSHKKDQKNFELNNKSIALNTIYVPHNNEGTRDAYNSKYNK